MASADERRMLRMRAEKDYQSLLAGGNSPNLLKNPMQFVQPRVPTTPQVFGAAGQTAGTGTPTIRNGKLVSSPDRVPVVGTGQPKPKKKKGGAQGAQTPMASVDRSQALPTTPAGTPPGVVRAASQFLAGQAGIAQRFRESDVARRQALSAGLIGSMQSAADIYGGRAPALLGQFVTGQQRQAVQQASANLQTRAAEEQALAQAYAQALGEQYGQYGQRALDEARRRSEMVSQIRSIGA